MPTSTKTKTAQHDSRTSTGSRPAATTSTDESMRALQMSMDTRQ